MKRFIFWGIAIETTGVFLFIVMSKLEIDFFIKYTISLFLMLVLFLILFQRVLKKFKLRKILLMNVIISAYLTMFIDTLGFTIFPGLAKNVVMFSQPHLENSLIRFVLVLFGLSFLAVITCIIGKINNRKFT